MKDVLTYHYIEKTSTLSNKIEQIKRERRKPEAKNTINVHEFNAEKRNTKLRND